MRSGMVDRHDIFKAGGLQLLNQRRLTGGKNLDGSFWIEIEGQGRVQLSPQQVLDMSVGFLRALGLDVNFNGVAQPGA